VKIVVTFRAMIQEVAALRAGFPEELLSVQEAGDTVTVTA
jgi:hypothetical protein